MKEILIILGLVAVVVFFEWVSNELAKESNWLLAVTFLGIFTYFVVRVMKEMKK